MKLIKTLFVTFGLLLLAACNSTNLAQNGNGGIGGTGIAAGRISNFGSIFVNGVQYDVDTADFIRNETAETHQQDYRIGEYVVIEGDTNPDGVTGTASKVTFDHSLQGEVTVTTTDNQTLQVLGQTVRTNALSVFYGFDQLADLTIGNVVEVSGVQNAQGIWAATSIRLLSPTYNSSITQALKGTVQQVNLSAQTFQINGLTIRYQNAVLPDLPDGIPENGLYVKVKSTQALQGLVMLASEVKLTTQGILLPTGSKVRLEGIVTAFTRPDAFAVDGAEVTTTNATQFEGGTANDLSVDALVMVTGTVNAAGILVAETLNVKESSTVSITPFNGRVDALDSTIQQLTLGSLTSTEGTGINTNTATLWEDKTALAVSPMTFADLNLGNELDVQAKRGNDGKWLALRITRTALTGGTPP